MNDSDLDKAQEEKSIAQATKDAMVEVGQTFVALVKAPRALWGINISYFLEGLAYFGILTILGKYLSEDVGLSDLHAGWVYSLFTGGITLAMLVLGGVSDRIGVRKALLVSLLLMVCGRFFLAASGTFFEYGQGPGSMMFWSVLLGLFIIVVGYGMYQPAAYAGVKAYTNKKTAAIGFAMIYAVMNLGAFFSGIFSPPIRQNYHMVGVYWFYVIITVMSFLSIAFILTRKTVRDALKRIAREDAQESDDEEDMSEEKKEPKDVEPKKSMFEPFLVLLVLVVIAVGAALIVLKISAPIHPLEQTCSQVSDADNQWSRSLGQLLPKASGPIADSWIYRDSILHSWLSGAADSELQELKAQRDELRNKLSKLEGKFSPEKIQIPEGGTPIVDHMALALAKAVLDSTKEHVPDDDALAASQTLYLMAPGTVKSLRQKLRAHAVRTMAAAYDLLSPVDEKVIKEIRLRLKRIDEDIIPMTAEQLKGVSALVQMPQKQMLMAIADEDNSLAKEISALTQNAPCLKALFADLESDAMVIRAMVSAWPQKATEIGTKALTHKLLFDALAYKDMADSLAYVHGDKLSPRAVNGARLASIGIKYDADLFKQAKDFLPDAVKAPGSTVIEHWFLRYGILILIGLIALVLLVIRMLRLRPDHPFHNSRFTFFIFILIPVQTLFAHNWLTLPYYINRAFGGTTVGENFEFFSNINPILIFFLTPLVAALTSRAKVYPMMIWGTLVMAIPTFLLALPPSPAMLITYILLMSVGEAMWQPRFLQLIAEIAPEGQTGAYMGIGQLPWFLTKVVTGIYSGWFLAQYCPLIGPQNTQVMWLIYGLIAVSSPIGLWMAKGWVGSRIEEKH